MIIVKLQGRLGNQLFQYATAYALARENNTYIILDFQHNNLIVEYANGTQHKARIYFLDEYNILTHPSICNFLFLQYKKILRAINTMFTLAIRLGIPSKVAHFFQSYFTRIYFLKCFVNHQPELGYPDSYVQTLFNLGKNVHLDGWFQSYKFFQKYRRDILTLFSLKNPLNSYSSMLQKKIQHTKESVGIHIRRTDAVQHGEAIGIPYYLSAIKTMNKKLKNPHYFFFSDDPAWIQRQKPLLSHIQYTILNGNSIDDGHQDLHLLSMCKHQIIANSSFSWWGAWLNTHDKKIVILPIMPQGKRHLFIDSKNAPKNWIKLEAYT